MKFTFKKIIKEGRYKSFQRNSTDIKLNKKVVGYIQELENKNYKVSFAIKKEKTKEDPAPFKWITFKKKFNSEKETRDFLKKEEIMSMILFKYDLYYFED